MSIPNGVCPDTILSPVYHTRRQFATLVYTGDSPKRFLASHNRKILRREIFSQKNIYLANSVRYRLALPNSPYKKPLGLTVRGDHCSTQGSNWDRWHRSDPSCPVGFGQLRESGWCQDGHQLRLR